MSNKTYPIGIQNFEKIRKDGYFYVDKTSWIYQLVKTGSYYFLNPAAPFRKKFANFYTRSLLSGEKGTFRRHHRAGLPERRAAGCDFGR